MSAAPVSAPVAVVTGASRGIGREVARQLANRGYRVVAGARDPAAVDIDLDDDAQGSIDPVRVDVTDDDDAAQLAALLEALPDGVDVLVNNAGVVLDGWRGSILDVPFEAFRETWEVNVLGAIRVTRTVTPHLQRNPRTPRIVNVSSGMGQLADMGGHSPAYRTSKTMLNAVTRILAAELGDQVFIASVCPGWVRTDMGGPNATRSIEDGADTVVWLATDDGPLPHNGRFWRDREQISF